MAKVLHSVSEKAATHKKLWKVSRAYLTALVRPVPFWCHLWVTRKCNLSCSYCRVTDNSIPNPSTEDLKERIDKLEEMGTCVIHLMGGEPLLRNDSEELIHYISSKNIIAMITTNATLLNEQRIIQLGEAGLDAIQLSTDAVEETSGSRKTLARQDKLIDLLLKYQTVYRYMMQLNMVLSVDTVDELPAILNFVASRDIAISIGLVMPPPDGQEERSNLLKAADYIITQKKRGVKILDPVDYFQSFKDYFAQKQVWQCDIGKYSLDIDVDGKLLFCSYLLEKIDVNILDLDRNYYSRLKPIFDAQLRECQITCLANCFYDVSYFRRHPIYTLKNLIKIRW